MADDKHPGGRPTVANPEVLEKAWAYLDTRIWEKDEAIPTVEGLRFTSALPAPRCTCGRVCGGTRCRK